MKNVFVWLRTVVVLLAVAGGGCSRSPRSKEFSDLDQTYQSGILSKDEYETKKAGLESQSEALQALDKALASGVITQEEYQTTKARLIARANVLGALERARRAGVFTEDEYLSKKAKLLADNNAPVQPVRLLADNAATAHSTHPAAYSPTPVEAKVASEQVATAALSNSKPPSSDFFSAQSGLKTINPSIGGEVVYGQVDGQNTEAGAMGAILRSLHNQLGNRPQVGKLFEVRGTESVAAFFSINRRNEGGGQLAGLIIAAKVTNDRVEAAVVADDAARFPKTLGPMMKTLFGVWHPLAGVRNTKPEGRSASESVALSGPAPLHQILTQDRSASISLPDGWRIVPDRSMMGTVVASGPRDESAEMGITFLTGDTNNPNVQRTLQTLRNGGLRNTMYAKATYYPYGGDMSKEFLYLMQGVRHKAGLSQASYNFSTVSPVSGSSQQRCVRMAGTVNFGDGKGPRELNAVYCASPPGRAGTWMSMAYMTTAPVQVAAEERATLGAILQSFNVDNTVIQAEAARIAAPAIAQIHAIGKAAADQAAAAHEREDIHNNSVYQHWDNMDKRSQEFENYQLGYSVISDVGNNVHGTFWNEDAAALVESNPDKFEYVSAPNYWKGVDY
jgi:hypothetical protein